MFGFLRRKRKLQRENFESFLSDCCMQNPSLNLEEALNQYVQKYDLAVRHSLDEPTVVSDARTKLHILEESIFSDPENLPDKQFQDYLASLQETVRMFDSLPPEVLKHMKEKE